MALGQRTLPVLVAALARRLGSVVIVQQSRQFCVLRVHNGLEMGRERGKQVALGV
jgi:hypothetical protein